MQPIAHTFEILHHDTFAEKVNAANVTEVGDWMHFTDPAGVMVYMAHKVSVRSIRRVGPVEQREDDAE